MLFSTASMSSYHSLSETDKFTLVIDGKAQKRKTSLRILGVHIDEQLQWNIHITKIIKSCYAKLKQLNQLRRFSEFKLRKQLAELMILPKLDYCNSLFHNCSQYLINHMQKVQNCAASFALNKYCKIDEVLELRWLPINERIHFSLCKLVFKSINDKTLPSYLDIIVYERNECLRNSNGTMLLSDGSSKTLKGKCALVFNDLPKNIRFEKKFKTYSLLCKNYFLDAALAKRCSGCSGYIKFIVCFIYFPDLQFVILLVFYLV